MCVGACGYPFSMLYDLATWTLALLILWALGAAIIIYRAKPAPILPSPKHPIGFMPPGA
jgi:hypothetical protein